MKKFNKLFSNICEDIQRRAFARIDCFSTDITGKLSVKDYFQNNIIQFNQDGIIISESKLHENIDFGDKLIYSCINSYFGEQFNYNKILTLLDNNWKFYNLYKNSLIAKSVPFYIFIFDFNTAEKVYDIMKFLNFKEACLIGKDFFIKQFKETIHCDGFVKDFGNCCILQLDSNKLTKKLVNHELNHYFQNILKINLINNNKIDNIELPKLFLNKKEIKYLFNKNEFTSHLFVDVISDLTKFYYKCYSNLTKQLFIEKLILDIKTFKEDFLNESEIAKQFIANNRDVSTLSFIAGSYYLEIKWDLVEKTLKEKFK